MEADPGLFAQVGIHGLAFGYGTAREFVAEIFQSEFEPIGKFDRIVDRVGKVGEELLHLLRRFQMAFGVAGEQASGGRESAMVTDGGEGVAEFTGFGDSIVHAICGK